MLVTPRRRTFLQAGLWPTLLAAFLYFDFRFAMLGYGSLFVDSYSRVLAMGVLLGIAGASFGVALSLGSGGYPPKLKGLAMGIAGAGHSGTALAVLFAPPLAASFGWQAVYGRGEFLPTYFCDQFRVTTVEASQLTMLATLMSTVARVVGGQFADRIGGVNVLSGVLLLVSATLLLYGLASASLTITTLLLACYFILPGAGSGALFQLVPLRWPTSTAVVVSMIGEIGAFGGGFIPNAMGQSKHYTGTCAWGFVAFAVVPATMLTLLRLVQGRWTRTWVGPGGRALVPQGQDESGQVRLDRLQQPA